MTVAGFRSRLRTAIHLAPHVVLRAAALCALYIAAGLLGRLAEEAGDGGRILLPQSGVALAGLVVLGTRYFPGVVAASLFLTLQANVAWPLAWGFAAGNTAGAVAGAWLLRRVGRFDPRMARVRDDLKARIDRALAELTASRSRRADIEGRMAALRRPL